MSSPRLDTSNSRYGPFAIFLHWTIAVLIAIAWLLPHSRDLLPHGMKGGIINLHRSIGMTIFLLVALRAIWRFVIPPPRLPAGTILILRWLSHAGHAALYALMFAVPLLGMALTWASGHPLSFWGVVHIPAPVDLAGDKGMLRDLHGLAADTLLWLAGFHAAAALMHHYLFGDGLLDRMLPARLRAPRPRDIAI